VGPGGSTGAEPYGLAEVGDAGTPVVVAPDVLEAVVQAVRTTTGRVSAASASATRRRARGVTPAR